MRKLTSYKFKLYKRFKSEIWGFLILYNKPNKITRFLLSRYKYLRIKLHVYDKKKYTVGYFLDNRAHFKVVKRIKKISKLSPKLNLVRSLFWKRFSNIYRFKLKSDRYSSRQSVFKESNRLFKYINFWLFLRRRYSTRKSRRRRYERRNSKKFKKKKLRRKHRTKRSKYDVHKIVSQDFIIRSPRSNKLKPRGSWWDVKLERERLSLFFGLISKQRFLKKFAYLNSAYKLKHHYAYNVIGQLTFYLFLLNLNTNIYYIRNAIKAGFILVNNKVVTNPHATTKMFDNIAIHRCRVLKYRRALKNRMRAGFVLLKQPHYIEFNFNAMISASWRYPNLENIVAPYDYPFRKFSFDWLLYSKSDIFKKKKIKFNIHYK